MCCFLHMIKLKTIYHLTFILDCKHATIKLCEFYKTMFRLVKITLIPELKFIKHIKSTFTSQVVCLKDLNVKEEVKPDAIKLYLHYGKLRIQGCSHRLFF